MLTVYAIRLMISVVFFTNVLPFLLADELSRQDIYCYEALAISEVLHLCETEKIGMLVIDASVEDERAKAIQERWPTLRLKQEARVADVICLTSLPAARSCAALTLQLGRGHARWEEEGSFAHTQLLTGVDFAVEIMRSSVRKPVQSLRPKFLARSQWA